jgi:hypothetical protein
VLLATMKTIIIAASLLACTSATAQPAKLEPAEEKLSIHDQIKADRAKQRGDEAKGKDSPRPWDRDVNGKRPWEKSLPPEGTSKP